LGVAFNTSEEGTTREVSGRAHKHVLIVVKKISSVPNPQERKNAGGMGLKLPPCCTFKQNAEKKKKKKTRPREASFNKKGGGCNLKNFSHHKLGVKKLKI